MKTLMWHCKNYQVILTEKSTMPKNISPEKMRNKIEKMSNCILCLITVEKNDSKISSVSEEIRKYCFDTTAKNIVLMPFVHLSNQIANSEKTKIIIDKIFSNLDSEFNVLKSHFGYHKKLSFETFGHKTNVRFRSF
jgi:threonyl-tRNA synthetase